MNAFALAALSLTAKATLLFAAAGLASTLLRRSPAAARHLAWTLAVVGALALPIASAVTPGWRVPVLPSREAVSDATLPSIQVSAGRSADVPTPAVDASASTEKPFVRGNESGSVDVPATVNRPTVSADGLRLGGSTFGWTSVLIAAWMLGALLVLGRMAVGAWALGRIGRSASAPAGDGWTELLRDLCWMTDVERPVRLIQAPDAAMPMTWGVARSVILLPAGAEEWTVERRRVVLLHELAHVARRDCLTQWLAGLACALYWFHPAAWYAARRLRVERERACDERVLAAGTRGADYAAHLLEVARAFRAPSLAAALSVPMARPSQLEGRLLAVLSGARRSATLTRRSATLAALAAASLVLPLAAMRPAPRVDRTASTDKLTPPRRIDAGRATTAGGKTSGASREKPGTPTLGSNAEAWTAPQDDQTIERTVAMRPGGWLVLDLDTGGDVTVEPWDRDEVFVRARLGGADWRTTRVRVDHDGDLVRVWSQHTGDRGTYSTSHHFELRVPRRFNVKLNSAGGGVALSGLTGTFQGHTGGGELNLSRLSGSVDLTTGGGAVSVSDSDLRGRVSTGGGGIRMTRVRGGLRGWSGSEGAVGAAQEALARAAQARAEAAQLVTVTPHPDGDDVRVNVSGTEVRVSSREHAETQLETRTYTSGAARAEGEGRAQGQARAEADARTATRGAGRAQADAARAQADAARAEGFAYATGGEDERIASIDELAANAPLEAAAAALARFAFQDPSPRVQRASVGALESISGGDDDAIRALARIARTHPALATRRAAVAALARCACETSTRALREVARSEADAELRAAAQRALERRGGARR